MPGMKRGYQPRCPSLPPDHPDAMLSVMPTIDTSSIAILYRHKKPNAALAVPLRGLLYTDPEKHSVAPKMVFMTALWCKEKFISSTFDDAISEVWWRFVECYLDEMRVVKVIPYWES